MAKLSVSGSLDSGFDFDTGSRWFTVRIRLHEGKLLEFASAAPHIDVPPEVLEQKLSLLKIAPIGEKINGVGWRRTEDIFYLRIFEHDLDKL